MRKATLSRLLLIFATAAALLAIFVPVSEAGTATSTSSSSTTSTAVAPTSAWGHLSGLFHVDNVPVTITRRAVKLTIHVYPYFKNQQVTVTARVAGHLFKQSHVHLRKAAGGKYAGAVVKLQTHRSGKVWVTISHTANSTLKSFTIKHWYRVLVPKSSFGSHGLFLKLMQKRLLALHMFIHRTGVFDQQTGWALDAYHRLVGDGVAMTFSPKIVNDLLAGRGRFHVRFPHQGRHAEGDLTKQLLALIVRSKVEWILPISSGKESTPTITGSYQIYYRQPEYTSDGMYFSDFFHGGYAIHGYDPAPDYPASHGCMRLWMNDAIPVYNWLALGDWVDSYGTAPYYLGLGDL